MSKCHATYTIQGHRDVINIGITTISMALWSIMIAKLWIMSELDVSYWNKSEDFKPIMSEARRAEDIVGLKSEDLFQ